MTRSHSGLHKTRLHSCCALQHYYFAYTPSIRYNILQRLQEDEEDEMDDFLDDESLGSSFLDDDSTGEESEPSYSDDSESEKKKK